jgi:hypothetical protein
MELLSEKKKKNPKLSYLSYSKKLFSAEPGTYFSGLIYCIDGSFSVYMTVLSRTFKNINFNLCSQFEKQVFAYMK